MEFDLFENQISFEKVKINLKNYEISIRIHAIGSPSKCRSTEQFGV